MIRDRLQEVEARIERACRSCGRTREEITLIAVSKVFPAAAIVEAYGAGLRHFGENYVQEFDDKAPALAPLTDAVFHLIGHLQSNKSARAAELFQVIETVDTAKLARRLNGAARPIDVMIEVKLSDEKAKYGAPSDALPELVSAIRGCRNLRLLGLMTVPPWSDDPEVARPYFRKLREFGKLHGLDSLSMGMSHDFEVAIEEGATHIRVGTALFGRRKKA